MDNHASSDETNRRHDRSPVRSSRTRFASHLGNGDAQAVGKLADPHGDLHQVGNIGNQTTLQAATYLSRSQANGKLNDGGATTAARSRYSAPSFFSRARSGGFAARRAAPSALSPPMSIA